MDQAEFISLYCCEFKPDQRLVELDKKLGEYYAATENCSNQVARDYWLSLKLWCMRNGYSHDEINAAKRRAEYN